MTTKIDAGITEYDGDLFTNFFEKYNTPEARKRREEEMKLAIEFADEIIHTATGREVSDLKNDMMFSCLRTSESLYRNYANTIKNHPEYQKYLQIYNYKWKNFLIIPIYEESESNIRIDTVEIGKDGDWNHKIISNAFSLPEHPYTRESNVVPVAIEDQSQKYWYHRISMNKWTWEISDVDPSEYSMDEEGVNWLIDVIWDKAWKKISDCSEWLQNTVREIIWTEDELRQESYWFEDQKRELIQSIMNWDFSWAVNGFISVARLFFDRKRKWRVIDLWKWLDYEWSEWDFEYLQAAIETDLDPEQRSKFTYLISKIKDKRMKNDLSWRWIENPSSFDLLLQQCKPWQIMLTNALDLEWSSSSFKYATQAVSWSRWCHSLIISDVIKDSNWVVTDAKIIQSTLKWWVHETTLKDYVKSSYSAADFLLADLPEWKSDDVIDNARNKIWEKYDRVSIVTDAIFWEDVDSWFISENWSLLDNMKSNLLWNNKAYCSELVFDAIEKSGLKLPKPHMSPSDLLMTDEIIPQYACYCDKF